MTTAEQRLKSLGFELPAVPPAAQLYVGAVTTGNLVFISGQGPIVDGRVCYCGHVGAELSEKDGYEAARLTALNALAVLRAEIGSLDRVKRVVKVTAWVLSAPGFRQQSAVTNGFSEVMIDVFGQDGLHARSAVSANELVLGISFEAEMIVELHPEYPREIG